MGKLKEAARTVVSRGIVAGGISTAGRKLFPKNGALIVYGHRVADDNEGYLAGLKPEWLDQQLAYLTRHYEIIALTKLVECFEQGRPVPGNSAVLTFDDGFRDNLTNALPLLQRYGVSATVFVVTGCISSGELPWSQRLGYLFQNTSRPSVELPGVKNDFDLQRDASRLAAYAAAKEPLKRMSRAEREKNLKALEETLEVDAPRDRMLSWSDLEEMRNQGIEIGAHTYSHPLLACISTEEAGWEMERSREDLRDRLGVERPSFCFPAGSCNAELMALARTLGFRSAFQPNGRHRVNNLETADAFSLCRVGFPEAPATLLEAELDGPFNFIRRTLSRKDRESSRRAQ